MRGKSKKMHENRRCFSEEDEKRKEEEKKYKNFSNPLDKPPKAWYSMSVVYLWVFVFLREPLTVNTKYPRRITYMRKYEAPVIGFMPFVQEPVMSNISYGDNMGAGPLDDWWNLLFPDQAGE